MRRSKTITAVVLTVLMVMNLIACDLIPDNGKRKLTADGRIVVTGCDWGPAVSKAIISVPEALDQTQTVVPSAYEEPLIARLAETGAADVHVTVFQDVHDMSGRYQKDGNPYQYLGHFSWIFFFNNECYDDDLSLWQWLSEQGVADTDYEE